MLSIRLRYPIAAQFATERCFSTSSSKLFDRILVANRGEIACRVMRTARKMGIETVAVYSDADKNAMHVQMADHAVRIGSPPARESYLLADRIIQAAKSTGAQAIHPGYGFLSENAKFAEQLAADKLVFVGPPASAIRAMGSKSESKRIMEKANVPCVPGYHGDNQDPKFLEETARKIGYPIMIKAVSGGGGKGMRIVHTPDQFHEMLESAKREAKASFNDDVVLLERYISEPRHIEVQVFVDNMNNAVYLFERDCSVQRRHQKIIEEAPAPNLSPEQRRQLGQAAVSAALAVGYRGAGTVEFIFDRTTGQFFFMEMNTRLQVEHPVTEMITGTDLVEWQLRVAAGERLPKLQEDLSIRGHAFEARVYAEDPARGFLPQTGKIAYLRTPENLGYAQNANVDKTVRVDTGVREGDTVSVFYDPMIAKLVCWGPSRSEALRKLNSCLNSFRVVGVNNNLGFLHSLGSHPSFQAGDVWTGFIPQHEKSLFADHTPPYAQALAAAGSVILDSLKAARQLNKVDPWNSSALRDFRVNPNAAPMEYPITFKKEGHKNTTCKVTAGLGNSFDVHSPHGDFAFAVSAITPDAYNESAVDITVQVTNKKTEAVSQLEATIVRHADGRVFVFLPNTPEIAFNLDIPQYDAASLAASAGGRSALGTLISPMPGKIVKVFKTQGTTVKKGDAIVILEAMKMEHVVRAPFDGLLEQVVAVEREGQMVQEKFLLAKITPSA
ncbi:mitochondrial branched-chain amino acid degradation methylcrotonyl-CoA carboxylase alpha subunit [Andalucia godoyi]|uniref:Mitochondrial branched-chain amino acid degradation methylcrotonyl-CoA carboxylase alpha subunit n=1 Tax=Andalucia godoyi TaxID=505711 RepID=A0A8K0F4I0_ANDGO|nr:mitochondrial branched-chain amino acid degradation methylcrotonyl-CoA carboxylase alpha subunit [Andalucia godoyi]|eukprot:ANDGO_08190.mRNA.1 mitochondrial branched-chain amino acid degradation methylcrotonyl-CoA carboxylase alpha subunit